MKKGFGKLLAIVALCLCAFLPVFVSCEGNSDTIRVTLVYDSQLTTSANDVEYVDKDILGSELFGRVNPRAIEGYNFLGWSLTKGGELISGSTKLTNDTILYAVYQRKSFTVTYNLNGYTGDNTLENETVDYNQDVTLATSEDVAFANISRQYYTFDGWYANANCSGSEITALTSVESNKTVYAKWTGDARSITCYTYNNGAYVLTSGYIESAYGQTILLPAKTNLKYHKFLGLSRSIPNSVETISETDPVDYPVGQAISVDWTTSTIELYEVWCYDTFSMKTLNADDTTYETVSVKYKAMDGDEQMKFTVPAVYSIYGYNFTQWRDVVSGSLYNPGAKLEVTRNYTLVPAKTAKDVTVTIKYHQDGDAFDAPGTGEEIKTFKFGETVTLANYASFVDNGFILEGWSLKDDFSDSVETIALTSSQTVPNTFAITVYSKVSQATNDVSFCTEMSNSALEQYTKVSVIYARDLDLKTLSAEQKAAILNTAKTNKVGHTFIGFKIVGGDNTIYTLDGANETASVITNVITAINLVPAYTVNSYKVVYYIANNQTLEELESDVFDYNTGITFRKTAGSGIVGKKFAGWSTIDYLPVKDGMLMPAGNLAVYAEWTTFDFEIKGETEETKYASIKGFVSGATGSAEISNGKLIIPQLLNGYPVKEIADNAFEGKTNFTEILIKYDDNDEIVLTKIGNRAFANTKITAVDLVELTNVTFGNEVFANTDITSVTIPNEWKTKIEGLYTYKTNTGIYEVNTTGSIGTGLFKNNLKLTSATIGNQLTALTPNIFEGCTELKVVEINANSKFEHFAPYAFCGTQLTFTNGYIHLPKTLKYIDDGAFKNVTTIAKVDCETNLVTVGVSAFEGCTALTEVNFFDWTMTNMASYQPAIRTIKANAFKGTQITILLFKYITSIEAGAFENCTGLASADGYIEFYDNTITIQPEAFKNCGEIDVYGTIPSSFTSATQTGSTIVDCNE